MNGLPLYIGVYVSRPGRSQAEQLRGLFSPAAALARGPQRSSAAARGGGAPALPRSALRRTPHGSTGKKGGSVVVMELAMPCHFRRFVSPVLSISLTFARALRPYGFPERAFDVAIPVHGHAGLAFLT